MPRHRQMHRRIQHLAASNGDPAETRQAMRPPKVPHELRVAVTMNGGVSLAVYIGGTAHELNELTKKSGPYAKLWDYVGYDTAPRVDVITGTSAGGINATALSLAQANGHDTDLSLLKLLWIEHGQIGALLRQPFREGPPSLLKGDEYFYPRILDALQLLTTTYRRSNIDVDLTITTTLLSPMLQKKPDDLGTATVQSQHAGLFQFRGKRPPERHEGVTLPERVVRDDFSEDEISKTVSALALAARASAGFPVAFEPTFIPVGQDMDDRPDMRNYADWVNPDGELESKKQDLSRFVIDGGVLANTPTKPALSGIRRQTIHDRMVRRALILVHPHATSAMTVGNRPDMVTAPPSLTSTIAGVFRASSSTGSRTYVEEIEGHNELALRWRDGRHATMREIPQWSRLQSFLGKDEPAWKLFQTLRRQRGAYVMAHQIWRTTAVPLESIVHKARQVLDEYTRTESAELPFLPSQPPAESNLPEGQWQWGLDFAAGASQLASDLLRDLLSTTPSQWQRLVPDATVLRDLQKDAKEAYKSAVNAGVILDEIGEEEQRAAQRRAAERENRDEGGEYGQIEVRLRSNIGLYRLRMGPTLTSATTPSDGANVDKVMREMVCEPLCGVLNKLAKILPANVSDRPTGILLGENPLQGATTADEMLQRLLSVEALAYLLAEDSSAGSTAPSVPVDFYQLSAQVEQHFAVGLTPDDKLAGMSLNRFGAFLKRSWRANDWIWGRLDAIKIIMLILLSPENIRGLRLDHTVTAEDIVDNICANCYPPEPGTTELFKAEPKLRSLRDLAIAEVSAAIDNDSDKPLTELSSLAAYGVQIAVAATEVPWLATTVAYDKEDGAAGARASALLSRFNALPQTPQDKISNKQAYEYLQLFVDAGIGQESVEDELPGDLVIRTAAKAAAASATMITSERSGLSIAKPVTRIVRGSVAVPYWAVTGLTHRGPLARVITATILAFGASLVALSLIAPLSAPLNALVPTLGVGSIATIFVYAAMRSRSMVHGAALLGVFIPLVGLAVNRTWGDTETSMPAAPADPNGFHISIPDGLLAISCVLILILGVVLAANINAPVNSPFAQIRFLATRIKRAGIWKLVRKAFTWKNLGLFLGGAILLGVAIWGGILLWWEQGSLRHRWAPQHEWPITPEWAATHGAMAAVIEIFMTALPFVLIVAHGIYFGRNKSIRLRPRQMAAAESRLTRWQRLLQIVLRRRSARPTRKSESKFPNNLLVDPDGLSMAWSAAYGMVYLLVAILILNIYGLKQSPAVTAAATAAYLFGVGFSVVAVHLIPLRRERRLVRKLALVLPRGLDPEVFDRKVIKALKRIGDDSQYLVSAKGDRLSKHGRRIAHKAIRERDKPSIAAMLPPREYVDEATVTTTPTDPDPSTSPAAELGSRS